MTSNSSEEPASGQPGNSKAGQDGGGARDLPPAALRALAEAEERRRAASSNAQETEINGRGGVEPVRYGDWEVKGLATDF